jgi:hypothetical protein
MRACIALTLMLQSSVASAEEWVVVRKPTYPGQFGMPSIFVDSASIQVLDTGARRATVKIDFLANGREHDLSAPNHCGVCSA